MDSTRTHAGIDESRGKKSRREEENQKETNRWPGKKLIRRGARLALIADAFPGLLSWPDLWDLDFREEALLLKMVEVTKLRHNVDRFKSHIDLMDVIRSSMAEKGDYRKAVMRINNRVAAVDKEATRIATGRTREEEYMQNRREFRALFGVKGK